MIVSDLFLGLALFCVSWGIVSGIVITNFVSARGTKINYFLYRIYIIKYVSMYKQITQAEKGKPGPWFYLFVFSMNLTLVFAILGMLLKS